MNKQLQQGTSEWLDMRKSYIGASDSPIIMGVAKWKLADGRIKTPYLLWQEKLGLITLDSTSKATEYGKATEPVARSLYEKMTGNLVAPEVIFHKDIPYVMASLDGLSIDGDIAVEIKCASKDDHELAKEGLIPEKYIPQVQQQLLCLGHDQMHYFSYFNGEGVIVTVAKDEAYQEKLLSKLAEFWECVVSFSSPPMTQDDYREKDKTWEQLASDLFQMKQVIKNYQLQHDLLEEKLKELSEGESSIAGNFRYAKSIRRGTIDYASIPELANVDLEQYRKTPSYSWRLLQLEKK